MENWKIVFEFYWKESLLVWFYMYNASALECEVMDNNKCICCRQTSWTHLCCMLCYQKRLLFVAVESRKTLLIFMKHKKFQLVFLIIVWKIPSNIYTCTFHKSNRDTHKDINFSFRPNFFSPQSAFIPLNCPKVDSFC